MKKWLKKFVIKLFSLCRIRNIILLESTPDFTDSSKVFFDYLIANNYNEKYRIYWLVNNTSKFKEYRLKNVHFIKVWKDNGKQTLIQKLKLLHFSKKAKFIITCSRHIRKYNKKSMAIYFSHGMPLKYIKNIKMVSPSVDYIISAGKYWDDIYASQFNVDKEKVLPLGMPRYDSIFNCEKPNVKLNFIDKDYDKIVLWLPTFRQHKNKQKNDITKDFPLGLPIIYNMSDLCRLNDYLKKMNMLIILKLHPAQDLSKIKEVNTSNIIFINDDDLFNNKIILSQLLFYVDVMITDYSSVLYDALSMDKPIIFTIDDFDDYKQNRGFFDDDPYKYMVGEKVKDIEGLLKVFDSLVDNHDKFKEERMNKRDLFFDYRDNESSKRIVEYFKF